ncbi:MAG: hypothetical protein ACLVCA_06350 [Peptoniphilus sp.]|uniref:hypothetical protein n=1 Tax=Peptoniphilus sp. TaxID=1971214 RepID=UPI00399BA031
MKKIKSILIISLSLLMLSTNVFAFNNYENQKADSDKYLEEYNDYIEFLENEKNDVLKNVKEQLKGQENTGFYNSVLNDIEKMYDEKLGNSIVFYANKKYYVPNGAVVKREDKYMSAVDTYVPNKDIDRFTNTRVTYKDVITFVIGANKLNNFFGSVGFLYSVIDFVGGSVYHNNAIRARENGYGIQITTYENKQEGGGTSFVVAWQDEPYVTTDGQLIR